ncbi:MAG: deoxyribodipyrimidine photo-lyase [Gemmatimonadales bacterium]
MTRAERAAQDIRIHLPPDRAAPRPGGEFVLYWMQTTHRAHDNFALNYAIEQANELNLPLQVYHGLRHDYPWANDRFHTWILQSVVDLYDDFAKLGINYAFWLSRGRGGYTEWPAGKPFLVPRSSFLVGEGQAPAQNSGSRAVHEERGTRNEERTDWSPLVSLAQRAALVVTDYYPTFIVPRQIRGLRRKVDTPVIAVDSATLIPLAYHEKEHSTARGIRPVLMDALPHYLWRAPAPGLTVQRAVELPFEAVLGGSQAVGRSGGQAEIDRQIAELVAQCDVDHTVAPSPMFRGGTRAGRTRLRQFLETGLPHYDDRNDPNKPDATSRLSPWLHFGNLSIHEILLAAQEAGPATQYAKFLDEALTWREVSHNFCHWNPKHRTVEGIPRWAREQLSAHESDPRPALYSLEQMEQARTESELWNAAQRSYLRDGYMHNYMRMLWGKAVLMWTKNAAECLAVLEHLNNKYSLDGRDPNSYGGIMWTFGKFDRPFYPRPIYGNIRYQSLRAAEKKFDVPAYIRRYATESVIPRTPSEARGTRDP